MSESVVVQPLDKYNQRLLSNVHPPDWSNPRSMGRYNMLVIGAGRQDRSKRPSFMEVCLRALLEWPNY